MTEQKQEIKYFVRIANTDLDGKRPVFEAMKKIKGVGNMFANAVCVKAGVDMQAKIGALPDAQVKKLDEVLNNPEKHGLPSWLLNRRKDKEDGKDRHIITSTLTFVQDNDIKLMRKIRCYKGVRHSSGLPVRGQRTNANFRRNKGKVTGVKKKSGAKSGRV